MPTGGSRRGGGSRKIGKNVTKCQEYLSSRRRIKNKEREQQKRVKNLSEESRKKFIKHSKIGRIREK